MKSLFLSSNARTLCLWYSWCPPVENKYKPHYPDAKGKSAMRKLSISLRQNVWYYFAFYVSPLYAH